LGEPAAPYRVARSRRHGGRAELFPKDEEEHDRTSTRHGHRRLHGIGFELARCCAENGFDLVVGADEPRIHEAAQTFRSLGAETVAVERESRGRGRGRRSREAHRPVSRPPRRRTDQNFRDIRHVIDTNITGTVYLVHKIGRDMRARDAGRILITGSIAGFVPNVLPAGFAAEVHRGFAAPGSGR
jgi:NAD(P)-dependent dehydrogenase (short-subunit alcohol dehydrogenase family)